MSLLKTEIKKVLKRSLGDFFKQYGYKFDSKVGGFIRPFSGGFNQIGFAIYDYRPKFLIAPYFLIRIDRVEEIVQKHVFVLEQYKDAAYSINIGIDHFTGIKEYEVTTEDQLCEVLNQIKDIYSSKIELFLKRYSDIKNLNDALNDERALTNKMVEPDNRIRAIIIAKLSNNPNFEFIADNYYESYINEYDQGTGNEAKRIRATIDYLKLS